MWHSTAQSTLFLGNVFGQYQACLHIEKVLTHPLELLCGQFLSLNGFGCHEAEVSAIEGQIAVITGGGSGVGAALGLALAKARTEIHLIGRRVEMLESIAAKARSYGSSADCYSTDLATSSGQAEITKRLDAKLRHVNILIHSAGVYFANPIEQASLADFDTQYQTNVRAPYALTQSLFPLLKSGRGQVVFINSSSGVVAKANSAQYDFDQARS